MDKLFDDTLGYYVPAFFYMEINTHEELSDLNKVSLDTLSAFHHEYVHFLQDITTSYGLMNISHIVDIQKTLNERFLGSKSTVIKIPVRINSNDIAGINIDLLSLYNGDIDLICKTFQSIDSIKIVANDLIVGFETEPVVEVSVNKGTQKFQFSFGAACLLESMAHLIEQRLFSNITAPQFPYKVASLICEHIYPDILKNETTLIYLIDAALNTYHPGYFFIKMIEEMKSNSYLPSNSEDIYNFLESYKITHNGKEFNVFSLFEYTSEIAERQISDYFTNSYFSSVSKWSKEIISVARNLRRNRFSFWEPIIENANIEQRRIEFIKIVQTLGYPIMINKKDQYFFYHSKYDIGGKVISLRAINEIKSILNGNQTHCNMKNFCKTSPDGDFTSNKCDDSPWEKANDEQLCPFGQVWKMWGLAAKSVEK